MFCIIFPGRMFITFLAEITCNCKTNALVSNDYFIWTYKYVRLGQHTIVAEIAIVHLVLLFGVYMYIFSSVLKIASAFEKLSSSSDLMLFVTSCVWSR